MINAPTKTSPHIYRRGLTPYRVFGFALSNQFFASYCLKHALGAFMPGADLVELINDAVEKIQADADVLHESDLRAVYTGEWEYAAGCAVQPGIVFCLIIGDNSKEELMCPSPEVVARVREAVGGLEPMWFQQENSV
ncbi:hypothetical protein FA95DRAFT_1567586 [Auriscalpium vulgare]|uniref:Uncharacterized protein n=1 Tax=Auriscalpium vulgare TaxID=40419 RepID=A0ACB8R460_9AGAM|nr:hypothetical protein FA95DRAFT_1567586 [Auriscalpium vulgare]